MRIRSLLKQENADVKVIVFGCKMQRSLTLLVPRVRRDSLQELCDKVGHPHLGGQVERGVALLVNLSFRCSKLKQFTGYRTVSYEQGMVKSVVSMLV